jgi:hypothetical protein
VKRQRARDHCFGGAVGGVDIQIYSLQLTPDMQRPAYHINIHPYMSTMQQRGAL